MLMLKCKMFNLFQLEEQILGEWTKVISLLDEMLGNAVLHLVVAIMLYSFWAAVVPGRVKLCRCQEGLLCVQVWRYISGRAASSFRAAAKDHPGCSSTDGTTAQCHWGRLYNSTLCACLFLSHFYDCFFVNLNLLHCNFCFAGKILQANAKGHRNLPQIYGNSKQCQGQFQ